MEDSWKYSASLHHAILQSAHHSSFIRQNSKFKFSTLKIQTVTDFSSPIIMFTPIDIQLASTVSSINFHFQSSSKSKVTVFKPRTNPKIEKSKNPSATHKFCLRRSQILTLHKHPQNFPFFSISTSFIFSLSFTQDKLKYCQKFLLNPGKKFPNISRYFIVWAIQVFRIF